jgi:nucleotide-binding universal stress UspA family protein
MYTTIVVGTDGTATAQRAVDEAVALAKLSGAQLHIAMAAPSMPILASPEYSMAAAPFIDASEQSTRSVLAEAAAVAEADGVEVTTHMMNGDPADGLLSLCDSTHADLLVVGNRGMQGARRFFLGSVSSRCAHHADCSILIVHTT